jgi:hypothetical protein
MLNHCYQHCAVGAPAVSRVPLPSIYGPSADENPFANQIRARMGRRYAILEAPSILGLKPTGVERLLTRRSAGPAERVGVRPAGSIRLGQASSDPQTGADSPPRPTEWRGGVDGPGLRHRARTEA